MEGELTFACMRDWLPRADALAAQAQLDLTRVTRVDSAGAAFLLELTRRAKRNGHELRFTGAPAQVRGLLEFLQIDDVLKLA